VVLIAPPPPERKPRPVLFELEQGAALARIYDSTQPGAGVTSFRRFGPVHRFDHHRGTRAAEDPERGVYYAAFTLSSCIVEVFGDAGVVWFGERHVASPRVTRGLRLLDLRGHGAMRAGSVDALAKTADRRLSQAWARYFYEQTNTYGAVDGVVYFNAHNDEPALVLFERAEGALECPAERIIRLDDPAIRPLVLEIALRHNLGLV
jgi:hypothetical protein